MVIKNEYKKVIDEANKAISDPNLMKMPFRLLALGSQGSGKSYTINELLMDGYKKVFENIILVSHTAYLDQMWKNVIPLINEEDVYDDYDHIPEIIQKIKDNATMEKPEMTCLIFEDMANTGVLDKSGGMSKFFLTSRHHYCSIIIACQMATLTPRYCRANVSHIILFKTNEGSEIKYIKDWLGEEAIILMEQLNKYEFLLVDRTAHNKKDMFRFNWDGKRRSDGVLL